MELVVGRTEAPLSVFLSSAVEDSERAGVIRARLEELGFEIVQLQHGGLDLGTAERIEEVISRASVFLILLSDSYIASNATNPRPVPSGEACGDHE